MSAEAERTTGREQQSAAALEVREVCCEIFYCNATPSSDLVERLRVAAETLGQMTEKQTIAFSVAAVVNFHYHDEPGSYSSGHKAAACLAIDVLEWLKANPAWLSREQRDTLGRRLNEAGSQIQRERAVLARDDAILGRLDTLAPEDTEHAEPLYSQP